MTDRLRHRGPDGRGERVSGRFGIGHRRLAVIDLSTGAQPLGNEDGTIWVTYNGEIYNFQELRRELQGLGHRFHTDHCDTEVIVHGYEEWGEACVEHFRGMFAFAILDERQRRFFLARDRLGVKPLYYYLTPDRICFASELQAFAELDEPPRKVSLRAVDLYLEHLYIPAPWTIFENVYKLEPGWTLSVDERGKVEKRRYWRLEFDPDYDVSEEEWTERLEVELAEAVRMRLVADVPVGAFLSGGIDSSLVVSQMSRLMPQPVKTFTIAFHDAEYNEADVASKTAARLGTGHRQQLIDPSEESCLPELVRHFGEPFADSSMMPTFAVSRLARENVTVALTGDGGDEAFAGYSWLQGIVNLFRGPAASWTDALGRLARQQLGRMNIWPERTQPLQVLRQATSCFSCAGRRQLWRDDVGRTAGDRPSLVSLAEDDLRGLDLCSQVQWLDYQWYLPSDILTKVDVTSMYHALEVRVPLVDHRLVELAARIPSQFKARMNGSGVSGKYLLRKLASRCLGPDVATYRKHGFAVPLSDWLKGEKLARLRQSLLAPESRLIELFSRAAIKRLLAEEGRGNTRSLQLWTLAVLAEWFRQHPDAVIG